MFNSLKLGIPNPLLPFSDSKISGLPSGIYGYFLVIPEKISHLRVYSLNYPLRKLDNWQIDWNASKSCFKQYKPSTIR
jgi:hypothetical protein